MTNQAIVRLAIAIAVLLTVAILLVLFLVASNLALSVREQLQDAPSWLVAIYIVVLGLFVAAGAVTVWRLLKPSRAQVTTPAPPDEHRLRSDIDRHASAGVAVAAPQEELRELDRRRAEGRVYIAFYGEISSGKTSLIRALVPDATEDTTALVDVRGGTTRAVTRYTWRTASGDTLILADVPGFNEVGNRAPEVAREEAIRAHLVVYVCDGDLTRDQWHDLADLQQYGKPMLIAVNKSDRYEGDDLGRIEKRLRERVTSEIPIVAVQAGGAEEIVRVMPDGSEEKVVRDRATKVEPLVLALQNQLVERHELLESLRDNAIILLAAGKLEHSLDHYRRQVADDLVQRYTRRAVIGGLAAFAPGADIIIQGTLATAFVRALCDLYEVSIRRVDIDKLLDAIKGRIGRSLPLILAIVGNAFKAFPGMGTVAGGLTHAVAYGLLFQSLGWALVETLSSLGKLDTRAASQMFEEKLREDMAARARELAALALAEKKRGAGSS